MARPISDEELQLKKRARRRLIGAIVLVTAVAAVLPMVLDSEPRPVSQNVNIQIPSPDAGEYKPKAISPAPGSADKQAKPASDPAPKSATASVKSDATVAPIADTPSSAGSKSTDAAAKVDAAKASGKDKAAAVDGAFVVQVAALADAAKAKQLEKQMAGAGVKTYTEVVSTQSGEVTRVRAGPYPTREAAEKARTQLKKAGLDGKVVPK
jgi:DedD protein